jgi:hypothetical protein
MILIVVFLQSTLVLNNKLFSMNLFRHLHFDNIQHSGLAAIR